MLAMAPPRAPNGLRDRVKLRSCEQPKARGGRILDVFDRRATQGRDANARFHDGSQPVRCSGCATFQSRQVALAPEIPCAGAQHPRACRQCRRAVCDRGRGRSGLVGRSGANGPTPGRRFAINCRLRRRRSFSPTWTAGRRFANPIRIARSRTFQRWTAFYPADS